MAKSRKIKLLAAGIACLTLIAAVGYGYVYYQLGKMKHVDIPKANAELGIADIEEEAPASEAIEDYDITNIALFAISNEAGDEPDNSDTIIILSIDKTHNKIKLSTILRDTYANVEGLGMTKINYAYAKGGPVLAIKTLNSNFNLDIKDYATVNYEGFTDIIDKIGGVEITVKDYEVPAMKRVGIYSAGTYNLNGEQALEYCKTRSVGNVDYERTDRQRAVLAKVFEKIKSRGAAKYPALVSALLPYTETSMSSADIINLGLSIFTGNINVIEQARFPMSDYSEGEMIGDLYYEVSNLDVTSAQIHNFIYYDQYPDADQ